jgi:hypothetical protein
MPKTLTDPLDSRITLEMAIKQERKLGDILRVASVTVRGRDTISATSVASWLMEKGYIPEFRDHVYYEGELVLLDWNMGASTARPIIGSNWDSKDINSNTDIAP